MMRVANARAQSMAVCFTSLSSRGTLAMCVGLQNQEQSTMDIPCVHMAVHI